MPARACVCGVAGVVQYLREAVESACFLMADSVCAGQGQRGVVAGLCVVGLRARANAWRWCSVASS